MRKLTLLFITTILAIAITSCSSSSGNGQMTSDPNGTNIKLAKEIVQLLAENKFGEVQKYYDEGLKSQSEGFIKDIWDGIISQYGSFKKEYNTRTEISQGYEIVYVTCGFEKGYADVTVQFSSLGKLAIIGSMTSYSVPESVSE